MIESRSQSEQFKKKENIKQFNRSKLDSKIQNGADKVLSLEDTPKLESILYKSF